MFLIDCFKLQWKFSTEQLIHNLNNEEYDDIRDVINYLLHTGVCEEEAYKNRTCVDRVI